MAYGKINKNDEAIAASRTAYDVLKDSGDRQEIAKVMNSLGGAYLAAGDAEQALQWRQRAYEWHLAHGLGVDEPWDLGGAAHAVSPGDASEPASGR